MFLIFSYRILLDTMTLLKKKIHNSPNDHNDIYKKTNSRKKKSPREQEKENKCCVNVIKIDRTIACYTS